MTNIRLLGWFYKTPSDSPCDVAALATCMRYMGADQGIKNRLSYAVEYAMRMGGDISQTDICNHQGMLSNPRIQVTATDEGSISLITGELDKGKPVAVFCWFTQDGHNVAVMGHDSDKRTLNLYDPIGTLTPEGYSTDTGGIYDVTYQQFEDASTDAAGMRVYTLTTQRNEDCDESVRVYREVINRYTGFRVYLDAEDAPHLDFDGVARLVGTTSQELEMFRLSHPDMFGNHCVEPYFSAASVVWALISFISWTDIPSYHVLRNLHVMTNAGAAQRLYELSMLSIDSQTKRTA